MTLSTSDLTIDARRTALMLMDFQPAILGQVPDRDALMDKAQIALGLGPCARASRWCSCGWRSCRMITMRSHTTTRLWDREAEPFCWLKGNPSF